MIEAESTLMFREAAESAACVARQLAANEEQTIRLGDWLRAHPPPFIVTCARGSSESAASFAKYLFETELGIVVSSAAPSTVSIYGAEPKLAGALVLMISQSGRSPDLIEFAKSARRAGATVVALVNANRSPLGEVADHELPLHAGTERSIAATKSYICSLASLLAVATSWKADGRMRSALSDLPALLREAWRLDWSEATEALIDARSMFVIGRGPGYAVALEAALKLKETCRIHAEAVSAAELRHGPMALVSGGFPLLCLSQNDASSARVHALASQLREREAAVLEVADTGSAGMPVAISPYPPCTAIGLIQSFYRMANALAVRRGCDPDRPPGLSKVTETL
jgi:glucosamine--fructose-6-phosphate aminotransferase (isomerizing)